MKPASVAREIDSRARSLEQEMRRALRETLDEGLRIAQGASSGPYKSRMLSEMGHPYAKRRTAPPLPAGIANSQSGDLRRKWRKRTLARSRGRYAGRLSNSSKHAAFFDEDLAPSGTKTMIARPIQAIIRKALRPVIRANVRAAYRRALKIR